MKLSALGATTIVIGLALPETGLVAIGALWVLLGPFMRRYGRHVRELNGASAQPVIDGRTFAVGTLLWLLLGVPSLLVGLLELGITAEHADWRWLPLVVGGLALGVGGLAGLMYALGSAVGAVADVSPQPTVPARIRIRSVKETGTFINERPRMEFELLFEPEAGSGLASYEVTKLATVPMTALGSVKVGDGFKALVVGPDSPTAMNIHWDQPIARRDNSAPSGGEVSSRLDELDRLHRTGQVTEAEYRTQRERILGSL